ncbi:MAG: sulfatase [bacterium]|nr:sulfatase [bacterium]
MQKQRWILPVLLAMCTVVVSCGRARAPDAVFLIVVDTLRPDRLSAYGYRAHETPHIDRLAERGVRFVHAQSPASWTVPSMGAMLTSFYPTQIGLIERQNVSMVAIGWQQRRQQQAYTLQLVETTLAEHMQRAGFRTAAFVDQPFLSFRAGFLQGFDDWYYPVGRVTIRKHDTSEPIPAEPDTAPLVDAYRSDSLLIHEFDAWLAQNEDEKIFVWLHLLTPHRPYLPPERYLPDSDEVPGPGERYDAEIRSVDDMIGDITRIIRSRVGFARTMIVFTSDHGEGFGEHGMVEHGHTLHSEVVRVPLVVVAPTLSRGVVEVAVSTIDVLPTILDVTGVGVPPGLEGRSLVSVIGGEPREGLLFSEGMLYGSTERSLTAHGYKFMWDQQAPSRLYDARADRDEVNDIAQTHRAWTNKLEGMLAVLHNRLAQDFTVRQNAAEPVDSLAMQRDEERVLKSLKSLGYIND